MTTTPIKAVVIGASAGAVQALSVILPALPADFAAPILIVVHIPAGRPNMLASLFQASCRMEVREAEDKEPPMAGRVYFAPGGYHLLVESDGNLALSNEEAVLYSRPSIDVLFESAAEFHGAALLGIILTGVNNDGAAGLRAVEAAGGTAIIQEPTDAYSRMMPEAAIRACATPLILPLDKIAGYLMKACIP